MSEVKVAMLIFKVPRRVPTGNPAAPHAVEFMELTKHFTLETTLAEVSEFLLGRDTHHAQVVFENSDNPPKPPTGLSLPGRM